MTRAQKIHHSLNLLLCLIGISVATYLTIHYYDIHSGMSSFTEKAACEVNASMSCNQVAMSRYATLAGQPISLLGGAALSALFGLCILGLGTKRRYALSAAFCMALAVTITGLFYLGIMVFSIKTLCLFCLLLDGVHLALCVNLFFQLRPDFFSALITFKKPIQFLTTGTAMSLSAVAYASGMVFLFSPNFFPPDQKDIHAIAQKILSSPVTMVPSLAQEPSIGPANARITIIEFSDFQCPFCKVTANQLLSLQKKFHPHIRLIFRYFPLNENCNSQIKGTARYAACDAAKLAICMNQQGHFQETYDSLFEHQEEFAQTHFIETFFPVLQKMIATPINLNMTQSCVNASETTRLLYQNVQEGVQLQLNGLPTIFINGHRSVGIMRFEIWNEILETLIQSP